METQQSKGTGQGSPWGSGSQGCASPIMYRHPGTRRCPPVHKSQCALLSCLTISGAMFSYLLDPQPHTTRSSCLILCQASCLLQPEGACPASIRDLTSHTSSSWMATASSMEMRPLPGPSDYVGTLCRFHQAINQAEGTGPHCLLITTLGCRRDVAKGSLTWALKFSNLKHRKH